MDNKEVIEVTMIRIKIGELEFEMTPNDARKLLKVLQELIGDKPEQPFFPDKFVPWPQPSCPPSYPDWSGGPYKIWYRAQCLNSPIVQGEQNSPIMEYSLERGPLGQSATLIVNAKDNVGS